MSIRILLLLGFLLTALIGSCFCMGYGNEDRPVVHIARNLARNDFIAQIKFLPDDSPQDSLDKEMLVIRKFLKAHETEVTVGIYDVCSTLLTERVRLQKADKDLEALPNELPFREKRAALRR